MVRPGYRVLAIAGICLLAGAARLAAGDGASNTTDAPLRTTLCELSAAPERFQGKLVEVRAVVQSGSQTILLKDETCSVFMWLSGIDAESAGVTLRKDREFRKLRESLDKKYKPKDGSACSKCALYKVTATFVGRFEHAAKGTAGFGYMNSYESQVVASGVSEVVAEEIERAGPR